MLLKNCVLDGIDVVQTSLLQWSEPEERWTRARDAGAIPIELFRLYEQVAYLSFGSAPRFLSDDRNIVFSYFSMALNCLLDNLVDAQKCRAELVKDHAVLYDMGKKIRKEYWDPEADPRFRRHLRDVLIALDGSLDTMADLVALIAGGRAKIGGLRLGKGDFVSIQSWLAQPLKQNPVLATPYDDHVRKLYDELRPLVICDPPETDWLGLTHILRNKILHFGQGMLRQVGLHDAKPEFYLFIPRQWPYIYERYMRPKDPSVPHDPNLMRKLFTEALIHQDVLSFINGLNLRVSEIARVISSWMAKMCEDFKDFPVSEDSIAALESPLAQSTFQHFIDR
jgi:hypothetical protein